MSHRINGALLSYISIGINISIALIFTPILVKSLGKEGYGLFNIVGSIAAYLYLLDFGINDSVLRFFVKHGKENVECQKFLSRMLSFYSFIGCLVLFATFAITKLTEAISLQSITVGEQYQAIQMLWIVGVSAAILIAFNPVGALIYSREKFFFIRGVEIATTILSTLVICYLLSKGYKALMVVVIMSLSTIFQVLIRILYLYKYLKLKVCFTRPLSKELKLIFFYASPIFIAILVERVYWKLDNILIGVILGTAPVAVYAIGVMFNKYFMSFATAISRIMTPELIRQLDSGIEAEKLLELIIRISRIQAILLMLVLSGLILFGQRFINLWLGPDYLDSYYVMVAVLIPYSIELTGNIRNIILQVRGLYWYKSFIFGLMALANIPLTIWLISFFGIIGAAISTGTAIFIGYIMVAVVLQVKLRLNMFSYFKGLVSGILPALLISIALGVFINIVLPHGWIGFVACVIIYTLIYLILVRLLAVNSYELLLINKILKKLGFPNKFLRP